VRDAIAALEALRPASPPQARIRDELLERLSRLDNEAADRCAELEAFGGPDCLLHGDFGVRNAMVVPTGGGWRARFIDWDHAGVGPASYDLSTLLLQLPQDQRRRALDAYCAFRRRRRDSPSVEIWNALFDTAERSRFANMAIWPALWAMDGERDSAFENLSAIASWFEALQPVLPPAEPETRRGTAHG
jgi:aminoglycoside phosphotransferase (APT) family kinase protein